MDLNKQEVVLQTSKTKFLEYSKLFKNEQKNEIKA